MAIDWIAYALLLFFLVAFLAAFFFYLRSAYRSGGWRGVRRDFVFAIIAIALFFILSALRSREVNDMEKAIDAAMKRWLP